MPECDRAAFRDPVWDRPDDVGGSSKRGALLGTEGRRSIAFVESAWDATDSRMPGCHREKGRSCSGYSVRVIEGQIAALNRISKFRCLRRSISDCY